MARRRMTLRRIDPWSVLKFGFVVNLCLLAMALLGFVVLWFAIRQLGVIDQLCQLATDIGFQECGVNGTNLFRVVLLFGVLAMIVQTGLMVFFAFLHNLIADLVGGVVVTVYEEGSAVRTRGFSAREATSGEVTRPRAAPAGEERARADQTTQRSQPASRMAAGPGSRTPERDPEGSPPDGATPDPSRPRRSDRRRSDEELFGGGFRRGST